MAAAEQSAPTAHDGRPARAPKVLRRATKTTVSCALSNKAHKLLCRHGTVPPLPAVAYFLPSVRFLPMAQISQTVEATTVRPSAFSPELSNLTPPKHTKMVQTPTLANHKLQIRPNFTHRAHLNIHQTKRKCFLSKLHPQRPPSESSLPSLATWPTQARWLGWGSIIVLHGTSLPQTDA